MESFPTFSGRGGLVNGRHLPGVVIYLFQVGAKYEVLEDVGEAVLPPGFEEKFPEFFTPKEFSDLWRAVRYFKAWQPRYIEHIDIRDPDVQRIYMELPE